MLFYYGIVARKFTDTLLLYWLLSEILLHGLLSIWQ